MANPKTAARDPIFWLHHANIDRLWEKWLGQGGGRANPVDDLDWLNTSFDFFDEFGERVSRSARDILDTAAQLGYVYDDIHESATPVSAELSLTAAPISTRGEVIARTAAVERIVLGNGANRVTLDGVTATSGVETMSRLETGGHVLLDIGLIRINRPIGSYYEVYLNLPEDQAPDSKSIYYVGNFSFFGRHANPNRCSSFRGCGQVFNITRLAARQLEEGVWQEDEPSVTFVLGGLPATGASEVELPEDAVPEVGDIKIVRN